MALYPYQRRVKQMLHQGKPVVLQAPTGSGKTRAALAPFVEAFFDFPPEAFPKQCFYSVPTRVLASQFESDYYQLAESYARRFHRSMDVRLQTGERSEDPMWLGDLVFATVDQVLSSALGVPYSLSPGRANINPGAFLGAYLVFDEFHLFPPEAQAATLQLLRLLGRFVPFILMTATFSQAMVEEIAHLLNAEREVVPPEEVEEIETREGKPRRSRTLHFRGDPLTAEAVVGSHERRSLAVCNTVERALRLYPDLLALGCRPVPFAHPHIRPYYERLRGARSSQEHQRSLESACRTLADLMADAPPETRWVMLLHSRFERPHRQLKEAFLKAACGPEPSLDVPSLIVVATQVVEVGLDITSQVLHTELAPAASIIQRAGRCARYPGESGSVFVYPVPTAENGKPLWAPYDEDLCQRTAEALSKRDGVPLDFQTEMDLVNEAHLEADRALLQRMREDQGRLWDLMTDALTRGETRVRRELIRPVDSRTVIVVDLPDGLTEESPFRYEGFSLWHGTLRGKVETLLSLAQELDLPWAVRYPVAQREEEESRQPTVYRWLDACSPEDISSSLLFAIHPQLVAYDPELGFRLGEAGDGTYRSPEVIPCRAGKEEYSYELESYSQHASRMAAVLEKQLRYRLAWAIRRFSAQKEEEWLIPADLLERAVRLTIVLHDTGKLSSDWQRWAQRYQEQIGEEIPPFLVAHTHWDPRNPRHREAQQKLKGKPPHAGEGAYAAARILYESLDGKAYPSLYRAAVTAIARHHSPSLHEVRAYRLHPQAGEAIAEALGAAGLPREWAAHLIRQADAPNLEKRLISPEDSWAAWFLYFLLARTIRICDQLSQELDTR